MLITIYKKQAKRGYCPSIEVIAPSLPLKSDMDAPFTPPSSPPRWPNSPSSVVDKRDQKCIHMHGKLSVEGMLGLSLASFLKVLVMTLNES